MLSSNRKAEPEAGLRDQRRRNVATTSHIPHSNSHPQNDVQPLDILRRQHLNRLSTQLSLNIPANTSRHDDEQIYHQSLHEYHSAQMIHNWRSEWDVEAARTRRLGRNHFETLTQPIEIDIGAHDRRAKRALLCHFDPDMEPEGRLSQRLQEEEKSRNTARCMTATNTIDLTGDDDDYGVLQSLPINVATNLPDGHRGMQQGGRYVLDSQQPFKSQISRERQ